MKKEKSSEKMERSRPRGTGATRLKFDNKPSMWPEDEAKKGNPKLEEGTIFSQKALGSDMATDGDYKAKSKKGFVNEKVFDHKYPNEMLPTEDY